jgi:hypothetical protein
MQAANAGYSNTYSTYNGTTYGSYAGQPFSANTYGNGYATTYDSSKAYAAQSLANIENQNNTNQMLQTNSIREAQLQGVLKTTTIDPGGTHYGEVQLDLPKMSAPKAGLRLDVVAGTETHSFLIEIEQTK